MIKLLEANQGSIKIVIAPVLRTLLDASSPDSLVLSLFPPPPLPVISLQNRRHLIQTDITTISSFLLLVCLDLASILQKKEKVKYLKMCQIQISISLFSSLQRLLSCLAFQLTTLITNSVTNLNHGFKTHHALLFIIFLHDLNNLIHLLTDMYMSKINR